MEILCEMYLYTAAFLWVTWYTHWDTFVKGKILKARQSRASSMGKLYASGYFLRNGDILHRQNGVT
jgi:hypothetical protein